MVHPECSTYIFSIQLIDSERNCIYVASHFSNTAYVLYSLNLILRFQSSFLGCLRHIVDIHTWATGECQHGELAEQEKKYLEAGSKPHTALQNLCRSNWLQKASQKYAKFR